MSVDSTWRIPIFLMFTLDTFERNMCTKSAMCTCCRTKFSTNRLRSVSLLSLCCFLFMTDLIMSIVFQWRLQVFILVFLLSWTSNNNDFKSLSTKFCDQSIWKRIYLMGSIFFSPEKWNTFLGALCATLTLTLYAIDFVWPMLSIFESSTRFIDFVLCLSFLAVFVPVFVSGVPVI